MYQRSSANPASSAAPIPAVDVVDVWNGSATPDWINVARRTLSLPTTWRGFSLFLLGILLIASATAMQVYLSAQILQAEVEIDALRANLESVERVNAEYAWQIAMVSRMDNIAARASAQGFKPVVEPVYVSREGAVANAAAVAPPQPFFFDQPDAIAVAAEVGSGNWLSSASERAQNGIERAMTWVTEEWDQRIRTVQGWLSPG